MRNTEIEYASAEPPCPSNPEQTSIPFSNIYSERFS